VGLRDILLIGTIYGSIPFILRKPFIGVLVWYWLSLMNPHRISWTLENQRFAQVIAVVLLVAMVIRKDERKAVPVTSITVTLAIFWGWMLVTTFFAFYPELAWGQFEKVSKILFTTYVAIALLNTKERIISLTVISALSIGFYGFKGGLFTIITGGTYRVWGPAGSFIAGNNETGLALVMTLPLLFYIRQIVPARLIKHLLIVGMVLCVFAVLGTQSRGAALGIVAMAAFLALKSDQKMLYIALVIAVAPVAFTFMPESWHERMATISDYQNDASAMGRITAWTMATHLALDRVVGGGFETFRPAVYLIYLPEVGARGTDAHSIYFELLGEHGFIGLLLFLLIGIFAFKRCSNVIRLTRRRDDLRWANLLARMIQVSFVGYAVSGAFLGLSYFDYYYALIALVVGMQVVVNEALKHPEPAEVVTAGAPTGPLGPGRYDGPGDPHRGLAGAIRRLVAVGKDWYGRL